MALLTATQEFNGGIIFVSFLISAVGAQTTLELLMRRTHIHGLHNWFLLCAAAFCMGGVAIWSMHFVGNNSLTLYWDHGVYHLSYSAGYTFASLVVAIACMFVAFAFVGITEEARLWRIVPSGILAGCGIAAMHYIGQFAIDFFILGYNPGHVVGAVIIACAAITAALYVFFKFREQWASQWYKRLGSAILMAIAVCGMHYTAMTGTIYYLPDSTAIPPKPALETAALIGIICAIIVVACLILLFTGIQTARRALALNGEKVLTAVKIPATPTSTQPRFHQQLTLGVIYFDPVGRILVNLDGVVPMQKVMIEETGEFDAMHPLFLRFFDTTARWKRGNSSMGGSNPASKSSSLESSTRSTDRHAVAESLFIDAARELANELRAASMTDLGLLFDTPFKANTIATTKKHQGMWTAIRKKHKTKSFSSFESATTLEQQPEDEMINATFTKEDLTEWHQKRRRRLSSDQILSAIRKPRHQDDQATSDDRYMFFVKSIDKKEHLRLLSHGFRFGDPMFISKVMSNQLRVPSDYMANAFDDMLQYARSVDQFMDPLSMMSNSPVTKKSDAVHAERISADMTSRVFVGLHVLVRETPADSLDQMQLLTDKIRRHAFPMVQLQYDDGRLAESLTRQERAQVQRLQGQSLVAMAGLPRDSLNSSTTVTRFSTNTTLVGSSSSASVPGSPSSPVSPISPLENSNAKQHGRSNSNITTELQQLRFMKAMEAAAQELARHYSAYITIPLASAAKLNGRVLDVPPFGITPGPSQLILYCACVTMPGLASAMNQTTAERLKCQPLSIYRTLAYQITDDAAARHHRQQRLYSQRRLPTQQHQQHQQAQTSPDEPPAGQENMTAGSRLSVLSLPPPPRAKRRRPAGPLSIFSTELIPSPPTSPVSPSPQDIELTIPTAYSTVLPARDRFWWLDGIMEETAHDAD